MDLRLRKLSVSAFVADKTYISEMLVKGKTFVGSKTPDQTRYRSNNIEVASVDVESDHERHCCCRFPRSGTGVWYQYKHVYYTR
jgi:hypothetical protein